MIFQKTRWWSNNLLSQPKKKIRSTRNSLMNSSSPNKK